MNKEELELLNEMKENCINQAKYIDVESMEKYNVLRKMENLIKETEKLQQENKQLKEQRKKAIDWFEKEIHNNSSSLFNHFDL